MGNTELVERGRTIAIVGAILEVRNLLARQSGVAVTKNLYAEARRLVLACERDEMPTDGQ